MSPSGPWSAASSLGWAGCQSPGLLSSHPPTLPQRSAVRERGGGRAAAQPGGGGGAGGGRVCCTGLWNRVSAAQLRRVLGLTDALQRAAQPEDSGIPLVHPGLTDALQRAAQQRASQPRQMNSATLFCEQPARMRREAARVRRQAGSQRKAASGQMQAAGSVKAAVSSQG